MNPFSVLVMAAEGVAFDWATSAVEMCQFGGRGWWWRLHWEAFRRYFPRGPALVSTRATRGLRWPALQFTYGETPPVSFIHMLRQIQAGPGTVVVDLGCGRALHLMAAVCALGVRARGYDLVPQFVSRGTLMARSLGIQDALTLIEGDILEMPLEDADVVHVVATTWLPRVKNLLLARLSAMLRPGTVVITHAWRLPEPRFTLLGNRDYPTTWGWSTVYFYRVSGEAPA